MRIRGWLFLACLAAMAPAVPALAAVNVTYTNPESYTDASLHRRYGTGASEFVLRDLRQHFEKLAARSLAPGQDLEVEVLDIDLAGQFEPLRRHAYDIRILRGVTWPRMKLRYALKENGRVVLSAEEAIADLNYLASPTFYGPSDSLRYEKRMIDDWFRARIVERRPPPG